MWCIPFVIKSFKHKGLRTLFESGKASGVQPSHARRLHLLKGGNIGRWSITVNGNWRMTFEFRDGNAYVLDYEDYH